MHICTYICRYGEFVESHKCVGVCCSVLHCSVFNAVCCSVHKREKMNMTEIAITVWERCALHTQGCRWSNF